MRTLVGLVTITAVFLGSLGLGLSQTGSWDATLLGFEATRPQEPTLRAQPWTIHRVAAAGFSIALPRGWRAVPSGRAGQLELARLRKAHPSLASLFGANLAADRAVRFRAFDVSGSAAARRELFVTYVEVRRSPATEHAAAIWHRDAAELRNIPWLRGSIRRSPVHVPRGAAVSFRYRLQIERPPAAPLVLDVTQLDLVARRVHYVVTFTTTKGQAAAYAPVFRRSSSSFRMLTRG